MSPIKDRIASAENVVGAYAVFFLKSCLLIEWMGNRYGL